MSARLEDWIAGRIEADMAPPARAFAAMLGVEAGALAVLFYGSNLRTGLLDGVLDFYVLLPGEAETGIWPRVSYREWDHGGETMRAKIATMALATFAEAAAGKRLDTTIWARFVQPSALAWSRDSEARTGVIRAVAAACATAARLACALGPERGEAGDYWRSLFRATYRAELRVESAGREDAIIAVNSAWFEELLPLACEAASIACSGKGSELAPRMAPVDRARILRWWRRRRRLGKALNLVRLLRASATFDGAARYAAWKIERHTGVAVELTPWRERHPVLAAPGMLWRFWRARRRVRL